MIFIALMKRRLSPCTTHVFDPAHFIQCLVQMIKDLTLAEYDLGLWRMRPRKLFTLFIVEPEK
ncbi:hypothetical protein [Sulfuriferula plumbiphila]|uniref:hypothetical protein n=1 Tax=Sulfuriferula plumbiphila TaxID=171865 RepID=UPI0011BF8904|nr:hypothetical protein [Sulfuriferula plumbiphila]